MILKLDIKAQSNNRLIFLVHSQ